MADHEHSLESLIRADLAITPDDWPPFSGPPAPVPLSARVNVDTLAWASVAAASMAAASIAQSHTLTLDPARIAMAYTSDRHLRWNGEPQQSFAPLSGFFRTSDGWVRTHGNYPWHADALRRTLGLRDADGANEAAEAFTRRTSAEVSAAITDAGGLCVSVAPELPAANTELNRQSLIHIEQFGPAPRRRLPDPSPAAPLAGIRVLDLTRVIAGPIATRTLALLGADVLRVDPPSLPEIPLQHLDTGHGKRSTLLDLRSPTDHGRFTELLDTADVVVLGYRPRGLASLGLDPRTLASRHPGLVIAQLSAWGDPDRRGFDSLIQAASGIAWVESVDAAAPGVLPAQALDHSAGYLLASAVITLLQRRARTGGTWLASTSLRRIAAHLLAGTRHQSLSPAPPLDPAPHLQTFDIDGTELLTVAPAVSYRGGPTAFASPRPWGEDSPEWRS